MTEDWSAVAKAIDARLTEFGWRQRELAARAQVSVATVRELQHDTARRRRNPRTLEALSLALGWHPEHLHAVLNGRTPPERGQAASLPPDSVATRLASIDHRLQVIEGRLDDLVAGLGVRDGADGR